MSTKNNIKISVELGLNLKELKKEDKFVKYVLSYPKELSFLANKLIEIVINDLKKISYQSFEIDKKEDPEKQIILKFTNKPTVLNMLNNYLKKISH